MVEFIRFVLLGLGIGALYAMVSQGIVLIYRGSGVVNLAQGAFVMVGGYLYLELRVDAHMPGAIAIIGAMAGGAVLGALVQVLILRPMRHSSPIERVIATLGVLLTLQAIAVIRYGVSPIGVPSTLPTGTLTLFHDISIGEDRLIILILGICLTVALYIIYRSTHFGRLASAVAENHRAAASLGHSPERVAVANWAVGAALAALAGALIAPITWLEPSSLVLLVVPALAAALVGQFTSFPLALVGALFIGVAESLATVYITTPGWSDSVPFIVIVVVLIVRGTALPLRSYIYDRLPAVGDGRIKPIPTVGGVAILAVLFFLLQPTWVVAVAVTLVWGIFCLSVVVLTGYGGQLSLAQYVLGGVGAFATAKFMASGHIDFLAAAILGTLVTVVFGLVMALPALRTRGINLAIATLGLAIVVFSLILSSYEWAGGDSGITVKEPSLFGWPFNSIQYPRRYAFVVLVCLLIVIFIVTNVRRGIAGRRLLAVRSNERAAAALGVDVMTAKLYAFGLAAALAGVAGILLAFQSPIIIPSEFDVLTSITVVAVAVVGGLGFIGGALIGATLLPGGIGTQILLPYNSAQPYLPLVTGLFLLYVLRTGNGLFAQNRDLLFLVSRAIKRRALKMTGRGRNVESIESIAAADESLTPAEALLDQSTERIRTRDRLEGGLQVRDLTVRFGSTLAVNGVSLEILPNEIHGLIGPNGAGKTTVIDALTGFVRPSSGEVMLRGVNIARWSPRRRTRAGIARSFQSLELFPDLTVRENIAVACDPGKRFRYFSDLFWPGRVRLSKVAAQAVRDFHLESVLDERPDALDFGQRRLVALARTVASDPDVLLLDEPAAGLSDHESEELSVLIRSLSRDWGMSVLIIEHNIDLVLGLCDRVTVLDTGSILTSGSPDEVRLNVDVMAAYLGAETPTNIEEIAELEATALD
jgi:sulfate-transporting ATPase